MTLDNFAADRQADPGAFVISPADQAVEGLEELAGLRLVKPYALVFDEDLDDGGSCPS